MHDECAPSKFHVFPKLVDDLLKASEATGAAGPWVSLISTVLKINAQGLMQATIPRYLDENGDRFVASEMPQVFRFDSFDEKREGAQ